MRTRCVTITDEQNDFIRREPHDFNLSKFLRANLFEYMEYKKSLKEVQNEEKV